VYQSFKYSNFGIFRNKSPVYNATFS